MILSLAANEFRGIPNASADAPADVVRRKLRREKVESVIVASLSCSIGSFQDHIFYPVCIGAEKGKKKKRERAKESKA